MSITGTLGARLYITDSAVAEDIDSEVEFSGQNWLEVGLIESFGDFGRVYAPVNFQAIADGRMHKLKGGFDGGDVQFVFGQDLNDTGQFAMNTAAVIASQDNYGIRIDLNDNSGEVDGHTTYYFRGLVMSFRTQMGNVGSVIRATSTVGVNSAIIRQNPDNFYDHFNYGEVLETSYNLTDGSDPFARAATIYPNNGAATALRNWLYMLVPATVTTFTYAADGTQITTLDTYVAGSGRMIVEAQIKLSGLTNSVLFFGLTDAPGFEIPVQSTGTLDTITSTADDCAGFLWDTEMVTDKVWLVATNETVAQTHQNSLISFAANPSVSTANPGTSPLTFRLEIETNGDTAFFINGVQRGETMMDAFDITAPMYVTIAFGSYVAGGKYAMVNYLKVTQDLVS